MHLLYILLFIFPFELRRRIGLTIKASWVGLLIISCILLISMNELVVLHLEEIRCWSLLSLKITYFMVVPDILYFDNDFCVWFLKKRKILEGEIPKKPRELRDRLHILDYSLKLCLFPGLISCRRWLKVSLANAPVWAGNVCVLGVLRKLLNIVTSIEGRSSLRYQEFVVGKNSYTHT